MSHTPPLKDYRAWSPWLDAHRPRRSYQRTKAPWSRQLFSAEAERFASGTTCRLQDKRLPATGERRTARARHIMGADGDEYRAYLADRSPNASKDLLFIRALTALCDLQLRQADVMDLLQHALLGPRQRQVRLVERPGGVMQLTVAYRSAENGAIRLGYTDGQITSPRIEVGNTDDLFRQVAEFAAIESRLESDEELGEQEATRMRQSGRFLDLEAFGPW